MVSKGFNVGVTGQAEFVQKCSFVHLTGSDLPPRARWTYEWDIGIEFSYHFAKYFGISVGFNYGTIFSYKRELYFSTIPDFEGGWKEVNKYEQSMLVVSNREMLFPIKLEAHFPLRKDLFFVAEAGVKIKGIFQRLDYGKDAIGSYGTSYGFIILPPYTSNDEVEYEGISYYNDVGWRNLSKIHCDLLLGIGLYYKLPYGDLLRFTTGINMSFNNIIEGYYKYHLTESYGTFAVKNDFIYMQLSYIHTLNFQKAKKYLKKNEYSFSSKKERREKIFELLKNW